MERKVLELKVSPDKGGRNVFPSQIKERPPAPPPMKPATVKVKTPKKR